MTTRSSLRCTLSGIALEPSEVMTVNGRVFHHILINEWLNLNGETEPDTASKTDQAQFLYNEWARVLTHVICEPSLAILRYMKVLITWYILIDPAAAIHALTIATTSCKNVEDAEPFTFLFRACLKIILTAPTREQILSEIEDIQPRLELRNLLYH
jgi:hypothetical protein